MNRFWPIVVLFGLVCPAQMQAQEAPPKPFDQTVTPIAWPPLYLQHLPLDFAEDPALRKKAEMYLDLTYAVIAEETLLTTRGGPKCRVKVTF